MQKKVCMLGYAGVGKTSLVSRYVYSLFSEKYLTTIGVKVDKKIVNVNSSDVTLILWDIEGEDKHTKHKSYYLKGASGFILVADITRQHSLDEAIELKQRLDTEHSGVPVCLAINKNDLMGVREITEESIKALVDEGWNVVYTSAKTGDGVEQMFYGLTEQMLQVK